MLAALTANEKLVLSILTTYASREGTCFPSQNTLAIDSGLCKRTVGNALKGLEFKGVIARRHRGKGNGRTTDQILIRYLHRSS